MLNGRVCLSEAVRVVLVEEDAQWKAEFEAYGYDTDMWATYGEFDEEWREDVFTVEVFEDETFGFICGNDCLLYTSPSPRDLSTSRMPSSA